MKIKNGMNRVEITLKITLDNKNISVPINEDFHHSSHLKILVNKRIKKLRG